MEKNYFKSQPRKRNQKSFLKNDYFITSFTCFIKLDITKGKNYKKIYELSEICKNVLSSAVDAGIDLDKVLLIND